MKKPKVKKPKTWKLQVLKSRLEIGRHRWYWWHLVAPNGEIVCDSETYTTKAKCRKTAKKVYALMDHEVVAYEEDFE